MSAEPRALRPDLPVPLPPAPPAAAVVRFGLTLVREPAFERTHRLTVGLAVASVVLVVAGQLVPGGWPVTVAGVVLAAYALVREAALRVLQHEQRAFEPAWLASRSARLRAGEFEVVRCLVEGRSRDLTDPAAVADLLAHGAGDARVVLDFLHEPATLERVHRRLRDVTLHPASSPGSPARVRFTDARYAVRPSGVRSYWRLGTPLVLRTAGPADPAAVRAGTGSTDRPGAAPPAGARPPGTSSA
ncbi:hypothetical protein BJY18_006051 [Amycolatopsis jiangsuensis]|uniref:Uncharacterized protein n=1 Tax=Amycolatopsis jiangsuensis TaxID=1181879 RepID=A0A840J0R7_9PSEU|nr:hypothetical protein [Amycolatopsis jiangsuensis]